jgi:hypothetical protein
VKEWASGDSQVVACFGKTISGDFSMLEQTSSHLSNNELLAIPSWQSSPNARYGKAIWLSAEYKLLEEASNTPSE